MVDNASVAADILRIYHQTNIVQINYIAATALFCFDYFLTFGGEVELVWRRGFSTSAVLFYAVRYPALFSTVFVILDMTPFKGQSDWGYVVPKVSTAGETYGPEHHPPHRGWWWVPTCNMTAIFTPTEELPVFSSLRVYALWDRNRWVPAAALLLGMANPAISIYTFVLMKPVWFTFPTAGCGFDSSIPDVAYENFRSWMIGARLSSVIADVLVLVATWTRTWPMRAEASRFKFTATFAAILMRNGTLYFVVLLLTNIVGLGLSRRIELIEPMSTWIAILTAILTSRFILDLHNAADTLGVAGESHPSGELDTLAFRTGASHGHAGARRSVYGAVITSITATTDSEWDDSEEGPRWDPRHRLSLHFKPGDELISMGEVGLAA
ncbi:hypothetical protein C8Q77DRAFT_1159851 [Trametes polyzona]|nr:hypothetical protein C8Q77DRAFT_1159851 [Trametes polyzona]